MDPLTKRLKEAETLTAIAVYFLKACPKDIDSAIKDVIHEVGSINYPTASTDIPLRDWLCNFKSNHDAIRLLDGFANLDIDDIADLEVDPPTADFPVAVRSVRSWMLDFIEKHGGREKLKTKIMQSRPTAGVDLVRQIDNKSLLTWALRRLSELLKQ